MQDVEARRAEAEAAAAAALGAHAGPTLAERFRQAYADRQSRLRARERRLAALGAKKAARDAYARSGAARELSGWLDSL